MKKGFTLIELLVVISIIAILSGIILASLANSRAKANDSQVKEDLFSLRNAAEIYSSTNANTYSSGGTVSACPSSPSGTNFLVASTSAGGNGWGVLSGLESVTGFTVSHSNAALDCGINAAGTAWSVAATLPSGAGSMCVDNTGASRLYIATTTEGIAGTAHPSQGQTICN